LKDLDQINFNPSSFHSHFGNVFNYSNEMLRKREITKTLNMKNLNLVLAIILLSATCATAQYPKHPILAPFQINKDDVLYFERVVVNEEMTKKDLFNSSRLWMAKIFKDVSEVEMIADEETGKIVGKGKTLTKANELSSIDTYASFTLYIYCKEGKAKIVLDNIDIENYNRGKHVTTYPYEDLFWKKNGKIKTAYNGRIEKIKSALTQIVDEYEKGGTTLDDNYSDF